jgi:hypothetical protein
MQYTGFDDQYGTPIYDGDIVMIKFKNGDQYVRKIEYTFFLRTVKSSYLKRMTVIGNEFEHPHLLNT